MKKVLFIATVLRGHVLVFHLPYMQWFQQQGYEVHCCAGNDTDKQPAQVPYCDRYFEVDFKRNPFQHENRKAYRQLKEIIVREDYDLIHCHTPVGGTLGRLAARKARKKGTRVCYTAHGFHFFSGAPLQYWLFYYSVERWLARFTDLLITINREDYARACRFPAKEVALVNGVGLDMSRFSEVADAAAIRLDIGVEQDQQIIMTVGEHTERKNHALCIRALTQVPEAVLVFCGTGRQEVWLRELAEELGVAGRVRFLGFRSDVGELLQAADVFIFPSLHEGLPVALMEAMAAGLPCVVSRVRGNADLITENEGGFLYRPDDVNGFAEGLTRLLKSSSKRKQFGDKNKKTVQQYNLPNVMRTMTALYREQLRKRRDA